MMRGHAARDERRRIGVVHGRFQPLHVGHLEYLLTGRSKCDFLIVGIANPDPSLTKPHAADAKRSDATANPFTYYERARMVRASLRGSGVALEDFDVVPFPINVPDLLPCYVPPEAQHLITIYDEWGQEKRRTLQSLGLDVSVLWERTLDSKGTSGTEVRRRLLAGEPWKDLVPPEVAELIQEIPIETLRRRLSAQSSQGGRHHER